MFCAACSARRPEVIPSVVSVVCGRSLSTVSSSAGGPLSRLCSILITLLPATADTLEAELGRDLTALARCLEVIVDEWPPIDGEWDVGAMRFFRNRVDDPSLDPRFGPSYVTIDGALVGHAGFFGAPDEGGEVEIGYSVCESHRRRGVATAVIAELCRQAADLECSSVRARVQSNNFASIRALQRNGFAAVDDSPENDEELLLRRSLNDE